VKDKDKYDDKELRIRLVIKEKREKREAGEKKRVKKNDKDR